MRIKDVNRTRFNMWKVLCSVDISSRTPDVLNFYFDRLRLYSPDLLTYVAAFDTNRLSQIGKDYTYIPYEELNTMIGEPQLFNSLGSGFEHDFNIDLSGSVSDSPIIAISGVPVASTFSQVYAHPTGYSETRNKDANISNFYLSACNPTDYLRLENQPLGTLNVIHIDQINALHIRVDGCQLYYNILDNIIIKTNVNGKSNGTLNYENNFGQPTNASRAAYDSLISKGWTITGTPPPTQ